MRSNLCVNQIVRNGTPEQHAKYLPKLISGWCANKGGIARSKGRIAACVMWVALAMACMDIIAEDRAANISLIVTSTYA